MKEDSRLPGSGGRFQAALLARPGRAPVLWPSTRFFWLIAALFLAAGCFSPTPATNRDNGSKTGEAGSSSPEIREKWDLWTSGTLLRGANVYQRLTYPRLDRGFNGPGPLGPPYTQRDFDKLASLGANVVTVSHPGFLADAPPADLFVIIAVRTGPGRNEFAIHPQEAGKWYPVSMRNNTLWTSGKAQVAWGRMWRRLSEKYRDEPLVVGYEIMVEPNANDLPLEVYDPDNFYRRFRHSQYDWNRLYPKIIKSIRQVDEAT
ncbi:MAG: hypothetical protein ACE5E0_02900, partial [Terriglobia bacterium]